MMPLTYLYLFLLVVTAGPLLTAFIVHLLRENGRLKRHSNFAESRARTANQRSDHFRFACETTRDGILVQDMKSIIIWANPAYCKIFGVSLDEIIGRSPLEFAMPDDAKPTAEEIANFRFDPSDPFWQNFELVKNKTKSGKEIWNQLSVSFGRANGRSQRVISFCRDVTEEVERTERLHEIQKTLEHEVTHDSLTDVANRNAMMTFTQDSLRAGDQKTTGIIHIDLDNFKGVNDTHGHSAGDAVLLATARALKQAANQTDMVARVGGDEFVVVCPGMPSLTALQEHAQSLMSALQEPFEWSNSIFQNQASMGAALASPREREVENLLIQSDFALYEAKRAGRSQVALYDEALHERHSALLHRSAQLAEAVDTGALDYFFQPKLNLGTGQVVGFEALVRWTHPEDGIIDPDDFLPLAKDLGLMGALDLLSMTAALEQKRELTLAGYPELKIAFNASPDLLIHPEFINRLIWGVEATGIDRDLITIEVLETTEFGQATEQDSHAAIIRDLRDAGFNVQLDDFGVGFAGLSHLATLDVNGVKIDRGLITDLLRDDVSSKIVRKIIELGNDLGLTVIAEGVEDAETADILYEMGCALIQGYWISKPMPADTMLDWLGQHDLTRHARSA